MYFGTAHIEGCCSSEFDARWTRDEELLVCQRQPGGLFFGCLSWTTTSRLGWCKSRRKNRKNRQRDDDICGALSTIPTLLDFQH